jgi:hypothetical protein
MYSIAFLLYHFDIRLGEWIDWIYLIYKNIYDAKDFVYVPDDGIRFRLAMAHI